MLKLRSPQDATPNRPVRSAALASLLLALGLYAAPPPAVADEADAVGQVAAVSGKVVAQRPGQPPRPLGCRDTVYQGEWVVTSEGSRAGILLGEVLAQVGERSSLRVGRTPSDTADMVLDAGVVRVIDPRDAGALAQLAVLDAAAQVRGNDAEGYVFAEKTGRFAMLCEWDEALPVARADEKAVADPGKCVIAKPREPLYLADAHDARLATPPEDACPLGPVIGALDHHLSPAEVAAGPLEPPWSSPPAGPARPPRSPCEASTAGCGDGVIVIEPPPSEGPFPGGGGIFPGAGNPFPGPE
jgi:hypothetical protein